MANISFAQADTAKYVFSALAGKTVRITDVDMRVVAEGELLGTETWGGAVALGVKDANGKTRIVGLDDVEEVVFL